MYSETELSKKLRAFADSDNPPTREAVDNAPELPASTTYVNRFGSWAEALAAAGFDTEHLDTTYSDAELLEKLHTFVDGDTPPTKQAVAAADDMPAPKTYLNRFGSWADAIAAAELNTDDLPPTYSDAGLREKLQAFGDGDAPPTRQAVAAAVEMPSPDTYTRRFGSWADALAAAGFDPDYRHTGYRDAELLEDLRTFADDATPPIERAVDNSDAMPAPTTYIRRFGSWTDALTAAGFDPDQMGNRYSDTELLTTLNEFTDSNIQPTQPAVAAADDMPAPTTYIRRFGSWTDALYAAGFNPDQLDTNYRDAKILANLREFADGDVSPTRQAVDEAAELPLSATYVLRFGSWPAALTAAGLRPPSTQHSRQ